jgi:hypothetical protein
MCLRLGTFAASSFHKSHLKNQDNRRDLGPGVAVKDEVVVVVATAAAAAAAGLKTAVPDDLEGRPVGPRVVGLGDAAETVAPATDLAAVG